MQRPRLLFALACVAWVARGSAVAAAPAPAATASAAPIHGSRTTDRIHAGFAETVIADSIDSPVSMAVAPDGRVFVCEQGGRLRLIKDDALRARPFVTLPVSVGAEEGLLGVAFDPHFERNHWVYVCYTAASPTRHNRIERYTALGDTVRAGSATAIFEMDDNGYHVHVGGALRFGRDGKLYAGTGENGIGERSQSLRSTHGKLLRIDPDGRIPKDNPFYSIASGNHRAIWARGLRNAFALDVQPGTGRIFINDVGGDRFEEVNEGIAGANYGWPMLEGPGESKRLTGPIHSYGHDAGCAITGGAFYSVPAGARAPFPHEWSGRYFYAEFCRNEIRWIDPATPARYTVFGTTLVPGPVDLRVGPEGSLYYLARGNSNPVGGEGTARGIVVRVSAEGKSAPATRGH